MLTRLTQSPHAGPRAAHLKAGMLNACERWLSGCARFANHTEDYYREWPQQDKKNPAKFRSIREPLSNGRRGRKFAVILHRM
jgi:hypothetical protein